MGRTKFQLMTLKEVLFLENFFFQMNPAGRYSLYPFKTKTSSIMKKSCKEIYFIKWHLL